jgi:hypothetical protein
MRSLLFVSFLLAACGPAELPAAPAGAPVTPSPPVAAAPSAPREVTVKRTFVSWTRPSGSETVTRAPDGALTVVYDVLENGRGPHVEATIRLAPDGTIAALDAKGHHTYGAPIAERFAKEAGHARWQGNEEKGDRDVPASAFFLPMAPVPVVNGLLVEALLRAGGTLPLLPGGEARVEKIGEATLRRGAEERKVTGYAIRGIDLVPVYEWMNQDGTWFGSADAWTSLVPEGWEHSVAPLVEAQDADGRRYDAEVAGRLAHHPPPAGLAFTHARVLDVEHGRWLADHSVVVVAGRITEVGPSKKVKVPAGAEVQDLGGKALLPGLWDMHVHLGPPDGALHVASGVTTVRDVGNQPDKVDDYKKRWDEGTAVGPHLYRMGFIEGRGEKAASSEVTAETPDEARSAVEFFARRGYDGVKIYNSIKPELIPLIAREAHAKGMSVTGHVPVHVLAHEAVAWGYDGIEHVNMLFLNFLATHDTDTRDTTRFSLVGERGLTVDLRGQPVQDFFKLLRDHHTVVDPTLVAFESLLVGLPGRITPGLEAMAARLPLLVQRNFLLGGLPHEGKEEVYRQSWDRCLAMVKALHGAGVTVVAGTDELAGLMLHHELQLFVRGGLTTAEALQSATLVPARAMKKDKESGSIDKGKVADLFVVDGDPLAHIEDLSKVVLTVKSGVTIPSALLYATVGVQPAR